METLDQKKRRVFGKRYLSIYINDLGKLIKDNLDENSIMSIVDTDNIVKTFAGRKIYKEKILFEDKDRLFILLNGIANIEKEGFYVFLSKSMHCGALNISSLHAFNYEFEYTDEDAGIISFINHNLDLKILLDFYQESENRYLEFEVYSDKIDINNFLQSI